MWKGQNNIFGLSNSFMVIFLKRSVVVTLGWIAIRHNEDETKIRQPWLRYRMSETIIWIYFDDCCQVAWHHMASSAMDESIYSRINLSPLHTLQCRYNQCHNVWNLWQIDGLFTRLVKLTSKETSKYVLRSLVGESTGDRGIPLTKGQWRGKSFHDKTLSWHKLSCRLCACVESW